MRIIGVDPGNAATGFGLIEKADPPRFIAAGSIRLRMARGPERLSALYRQLLEIIELHRPDTMSLERSFVALNVHSAFALGEARAVAMLAAAHRQLPLFEYTPTEVKLAVAGYGRADKQQVKLMVQRSLQLPEDCELDSDAADALASALCHLFHARIAGPAAAGCKPVKGVRMRI